MGKFTKKTIIAITNDLSISGKARALLSAIFILKDSRGCCCCNYQSLMSMAGIGNRRTLSEKIGELVEYGVLKVENQYNNKTHSRMANKYTLVAV